MRGRKVMFILGAEGGAEADQAREARPTSRSCGSTTRTRSMMTAGHRERAQACSRSRRRAREPASAAATVSTSTICAGSSQRATRGAQRVRRDRAIARELGGEAVGLVGVQHVALEQLTRGARGRSAPQIAPASRRVTARSIARGVERARALLVEDRAHRGRIGAGAQIDRDVDLAAEPARSTVHADTRCASWVS